MHNAKYSYEKGCNHTPYLSRMIFANLKDNEYVLTVRSIYQGFTTRDAKPIRHKQPGDRDVQNTAITISLIVRITSELNTEAITSNVC